MKGISRRLGPDSAGRWWQAAGSSLAALAPRVAPLLLCLVAVKPLAAQVRLTQQEALRLAFPEPATIERRTAFLSDADLDRARQLAGPDARVEQRVVSYYLAMHGDVVLGAAYFDAHRVRTLPEVLMIVLSPEARVQRIEVLKFSEPPEYEAPESWLHQFSDRSLDDDLQLKRSIVNLTGATLTSGAVTRAVRRVLALHQVIRPYGKTESGSSR